MNDEQWSMELPEGWASATIPEVVGPGGLFSDGDWIESKDQDMNGDVRLIQLADIGDGEYRNRSSRFLTRVRADALSCTFLELGDILVARMPEPLGRACAFPGDAKPSVTAVDVCIIRPQRGDVDTQWLLHIVNAPDFRSAIAEYERGTTRKRISRTNLGRIRFPVPPLAEQKRILAKVEALLARVNAARERLAKVPALLKRFRQSVLAAACSGQLTADWRESHDTGPAKAAVQQLRMIRPSKDELEAEFPVKRWRVWEVREPQMDQLLDIPPSWAWLHLPEIGYMNRGRSRNRPRNAPHLYGGTYPFIQTGDIAQSRGRIRQHKQTYSDAGLAQSRMWPTDTIRITIAANIADSAMLTYPVCFPDSVVGLIPDPELCVAEFVEFFVRTAREDLSQFAPATAQKNINIAILEEVAVPLPPLAEQQEIVRCVETLFTLADKIEARVQAATARVEKITQAILAKAFRGELVPTEAELARQEARDYEPAAVLLERIRAARAAAEPTGSGRTPRRRRR